MILGRRKMHHLLEFTFRQPDQVLKSMQNDFLNMMARVPKERDLRVEAHGAVHYTNPKVQDEDNERVEAMGRSSY